MKQTKIFEIWVKLHNKEEWHKTSCRFNTVMTDKEDKIITLPTVEEVEKIQDELKNLKVVKKHFSNKKKVVLYDGIDEKIFSTNNRKLAKCGGIDI